MVLAAEHYNMIARMVEKGLPVKLRVAIQSHYLTADTKSYNVVADLPGTDAALKNDVVLLGGHLDSWHTGTGASDNADGAAAVMEALRILKAVGARPRRHSSGAVERRGTGPARIEGVRGSAPRGRREQESASIFRSISTSIQVWDRFTLVLGRERRGKSLFDAWLAPLKDLDGRRNVIAGITNTDHLSFKAVGIPGFTPIQDYATYDVRTHHTNMDTHWRVREQDLKQNAVSLAWFAYNAAMMNDRFPREATQAGIHRPAG
jgi:hypothetical protein